MVSINAVLGEGGIISQAEIARQHQANAEASDNDSIGALDEVINDYFTPKLYAKMYSLNDGKGDVLVLSSKNEYTDTEGLTLKEDYGNIGNEVYEYEAYYEDYYDEEIDEWIYRDEVIGNFPPWLEEYSDIDGEYYREVYYENYDLVEVRIVDEISPMSTTAYFCNCWNLKEIKGIENLNTENVTDMRQMFQNCSLTSLDLSGFNTENVTNMRNMFSQCRKLTSLDLSGFNTENVTDMSNMFIKCSELSNLDLSGFNTENVTNMRSMFYYCQGLTSLDVSGFKTENVTDMSFMFGYCQGLTSLDLSGFNTENVTAMCQMFESCNKLKTLDLSRFNTENVTDMSAMFYYCPALKNIYVGSGWKTEQADTSRMFTNCSATVGEKPAET